MLNDFMSDNVPDMAGRVNAVGGRCSRARMPGGEAGLRLRSPLIDQKNKQNQKITITRYVGRSNGTDSLHPVQVMYIQRCPDTRSRWIPPSPSLRFLRRWPNPVSSTALGALYVALTPERLPCLLPPASLGTGNRTK